MEIWIAVVVGILCIIAGYLCGVYLEKVSEKKQVKGLLVLDKKNLSVYFQAFEDPMLYHNGSRVLLEIWSVDESQVKQEP